MILKDCIYYFKKPLKHNIEEVDNCKLGYIKMNSCKKECMDYTPKS